jgi:7-keto-8-aminopelargonate synthetase-like enzyme
LLKNAEYLRSGLKSLGYDTATSETPIIPVIIGTAEKTFRFWRGLFDNGVYANAVVAPAVPPNACRIRTSLIATHTHSQLDRVIDVFKKVGAEQGVL